MQNVTIDTTGARHPFVRRRQEIGKSLPELQAELSARGFNYPMETIQAIERGERSFPLEMPGFTVAMSECLNIPAGKLYEVARASSDALRNKRTFTNYVVGLRPQNQVLLRIVLDHPNLTLIPGFNAWFEFVKSLALLLPDSWFKNHA